MTQVSEFDIEDVGDILKEVERSFNIKFADNELAHVATFGQLCDEVERKITLPDTGGCTTQQAFYKIREAIAKIVGIPKEQIKIDSKLELIFPKNSRRMRIKQIEELLDVKLQLLSPKGFIVALQIALLLSSFVLLYFNWRIGLILLAVFIVSIPLVSITAKEFRIINVGDLAQKMASKQYMKSRSNPLTVNRSEIVKMLELLFNKHFYLEEPIKRETVIVTRWSEESS
jgi:hypothetical protein